MMINQFPGGVWPVMLTPFTENNQVDYESLGELVEWYIASGVSGLFAVCQSSEMFYLSLEERTAIARFVKEKAAGRVPVIASGHIADSFEEQVYELNEMAKTDVDAVILITNRIAAEEESDQTWIQNLEKLLEKLPEDTKLGFYECPYPYKRVMTKETTKWCADTGRFYFLKDTSCDLNNIKEKLEVIKGTNLELYNANTATLLPSLQAGARGYSGVMANMQCRLYVELCSEYGRKDMTELADLLTICALIERQLYPVNAKYYLRQEGLNMQIACRNKNAAEFTETYKGEIKALRRVTRDMEQNL